MNRRSILGLNYTLQSLAANGVDLAPLAESFGIEQDNLVGDGYIDRALELQIYQQLLEQTQVPAELGLLVGQTVSFVGYGPLTLLLLCCETAWQAFQTGMQYQSLTYLFGELGLDLGERETLLHITPTELPATCQRFIIDRDLSGTYQLISDVQVALGTDFKPNLVRLPYPEPNEKAKYEARYGCPIEFGAARSEIVMATERMGLKFPSANPMGFKIYKQQCDDLVAKLAEGSGEWKQDVQDYLALFTSTYPSIQKAAKTFAMTERSFRRKLSAEGTNYRDLLAEVRCNKAKQLLASSSASIDSIAATLGYTDASSFIHAFQRWTGFSPAKYRASLSNFDGG